MSASIIAALERLDALATERGIRLSSDAPLAPLTTLRVGGAADRLATPSSVGELVTLLKIAADAGVETFMLG